MERPHLYGRFLTALSTISGTYQLEPKKIGVILAGNPVAAVDMVIRKMMVFEGRHIPLVRGLMGHGADYLIGSCDSCVEVYSNDVRLHGI